MHMNKIRKTALINASLTTLYVAAVGLFMYYGSMVKIGKANAFLAPIALLLLFVFSASITGYLIFGKPAQMYIDGKKNDALKLLFNTLLFFAAFTFLFLFLLLSFTI